jgi:hypothetical protein
MEDISTSIGIHGTGIRGEVCSNHSQKGLSKYCIMRGVCMSKVRYISNTNEFINDYGLRVINAMFRPAKTIECNPPYIAGKRDSCWIKTRKDDPINYFNKEECEHRVGMSLLPLDE